VLTGAHIDVWIARPEDARDPARRERLLALLTRDEQARVASFTRESSRREHLVARAQLRWVLSRYADVPPLGWRFCVGEQGRPRLAPAQHDLDLRFSVSHTTGLVACAVTIGHDLGVDVEHVTPRVSPIALAERFFTAAEADDIRARSPADRTDRFIRYWTLKEAWLKASGVGLGGSLAARAFRLPDADEPHGERACNEGGDENCRAVECDVADGWQFWQWRPTSEHWLAIALDLGRSAGGPIEIDVVKSEHFA
jgi:4'-phosphopantetheinyl transferase